MRYTPRLSRTSQNGLWNKLVGLVLMAALIAGTVHVTDASAQTYREGVDYNFQYESAVIFGEDSEIRRDWNRFGGANAIPYYIHEDLIAADPRYEDAIISAFLTYENEPTANIDFIYMGSTTVLSEYSPNGALPADGINVVSFGPLEPGIATGSEVSGVFDTDENGWPTGTGSGQFDLTIANDVPHGVGALPGVIDMETMVLHELGHVLGLGHPVGLSNVAVMRDLFTDFDTRRVLTEADLIPLRSLYPVVNGFALCQGRVVTQNMNLGASGVGTPGDDVILGTSQADTIQGLQGNDVVCAGDGADQVFGDDGDDRILGEGGSDLLRAGAGSDTVFGGFGIDYIHGDSGEDTLDGQGGSDRMWGGADNDLMLGDSGADRMFGGPGNDEMRGMGGQDFMWGGAGNDLMQGNFQTDNMWGGPGNDEMYGAGGKDSLFGEAGDDTLVGGNNTDYLNGGDGVDTANGGRGRDKPVLEPKVRASNGQLFDGSGCIAETIGNCQPTP